MRARRRHYHALEIPVAQLCALIAEQNRSPEHRRDPFRIDEFYQFVERDDSRPDQRTASAYQALLAAGNLPPWALFCFEAFRDGDPKGFPADPAMVGEGFLLLAPIESEAGFTGTMIAERRASGQVIEAHWDGAIYRVRVPEFQDFVVAQGGAEVARVG